MAERESDLRVIRTRKLIHDAFMSMVGEMDLAKITVKDLTQRAGINRKTFYLHFDSIEALYDCVMNDVMNDFFDNYETTADIPEVQSAWLILYESVFVAAIPPPKLSVFPAK